MAPTLLTKKLVFPPAESAPAHGLLAIGGDLRPERLLLAYSSGIFPWPHEGLPLLWFSPDPRMVLQPHQVHAARSLRKVLRQGRFRWSMDEAFADVMRGCASVDLRAEGTWITDEMLEAYTHLHELGFAHSVETWSEGRLVGGLYGVSLGDAFFGESMFSAETDASKTAFVRAMQQFARWGLRLVDCQLPTPHLATLGARPCARRTFLVVLRQVLQGNTRRGRWHLDEDLAGPSRFEMPAAQPSPRAQDL